MLLTVGIPVFNGEEYIRESIQSVLDQTYTDFELIVTDDGSTDGTMEIVRSFADPRLKILCDGSHKGLAIRLNEQIAMARGEYFVRMDADDVMLPQRLERQSKFVSLHPDTDVVGSSAIVVDEKGMPIGWRGACEWQRNAGRTVENLSYVKSRSFMHPTVMGRTEWFRKYYYNPACEGCEDLDLWARSSETSNFYNICEPLLLYRDPQKLNLETYLFRRRQERYVLRINSERFSALYSWWRKISSHAKSITAWLLSKINLEHLLLGNRNASVSPLNNHVLHVITSLRTGGAEKLMVDLLPRLCFGEDQTKQRVCNRRIDAELVVFDGVRTPFFDSLEKTGVKIHSFSREGSVYNPLNILRLIPLMRRADVVHTHNTSPQLFTAVANMFVGARLITTEHNTSNRRRNHSFLRPVDRWMYGRYEKIICISDQAELNLCNYLDNPRLNEKILTIYNGIDLSKFCLNTQILPSSGKIITMVAAFREQKDHKTLIRAIGLLPDDYSLRLVGTGDESLIKECQSLVSDLRLESRVHFLGVRSDIVTLLKSSDVVVLSSHYEGLSLSSIEGMASGKPFIASDVDGLHEIVSGYGILFPHENAEALAAAIRRCCEDKAYADSVAKKCQEKAMQYDICVMAEKYNQLYR